MAPQTISVIGTLNVDLIVFTDRIPEKGETVVSNRYFEGLGGKGANAAIAAYRTCHKKPRGNTQDLENPSVDPPAAEPITSPAATSNTHLTTGENAENDIQVRMVGAVGEDQYADYFHKELQKNGVDTSGLTTMSGTKSNIGFGIVEEYSGDIRALPCPVAAKEHKEKDFLKVESLAPKGPRPDLIIAQMEIRPEVVQQIIETAGNNGIEFLLNAAPGNPVTQSLYPYITHLLVNETEAAIMSGRELYEVRRETWSDIAQEFLDRGVKNFVITLGREGAYYATLNERGHVPAFMVKVGSEMGAGDTFTGAYASEYLRQKAEGKWNIESAVLRANKAAAFIVQYDGCQEGIPWADEIDTLVATLGEKFETLTVDGEGSPPTGGVDDMKHASYDKV